jgi:phage shock protein A
MRNELLAKLDRINNRIADMEDAAANGPENLYCDGERSREDVEAEFRALYRERDRLESVLRKLN